MRGTVAAGTVTVSWLGLWFHDAREFPGSRGFTADALVMGAIAVALLAATWRTEAVWPVAALLAFGLLMLIGGALSVLPLPILPFVPEQSGYHYASHVVYAVAQLPLIALCAYRLIKRRQLAPKRSA